MITYKHEEFIGQAIESVLMQETDFAVELVIGDDASPDNTRTIIEDYVRRYPERIKLLPAEPSLGAQLNFTRVFRNCKGKYIALLEGDDYWTDPTKLQHQVTYLQNHPQAVAVFTNCSLVNMQGEVFNESFVPVNFQHNLVLKQILQDYCPPTLTVLYRNILPAVPDSFSKVPNGDLFLFALFAHHGTIDYLPFITAHYRHHPGGAWSAQSPEKQFRNILLTKLTMLHYFGSSYRKELMRGINWAYTQLLALFWQQKRRNEFWSSYRDFALLSIKTFNKEFPAFTLRMLLKK